MAMRAQFFEGTVASSITAGIPVGTAINIMGRIPVDGAPAWSGIFTDYRGGMGRIQFTKATEFIVIEHIASSPVVIGLLTTTFNPGAVQIKINTTEYFLNPDGSQNNGIPGFAAPYPRTTAYQDAFSLDPDVYVLPGQNWELVYRNTVAFAIGTTTRDLVRIACKFTLYDGTDAVIANKLLEMGISVKPANIDWYKRKLIEARTA